MGRGCGCWYAKEDALSDNQAGEDHEGHRISPPCVKVEGTESLASLPVGVRAGPESSLLGARPRGGTEMFLHF